MLRFDLISIFPEYLAPLKLSLLGKAQEKGIISINVHDLRDQTTDAHHSVDDTPYGGGAGMVMSAVVWGDAIDQVSKYYRQQKNFRVHEVSIGDYVLGGGEVAAMVIIEATARLIPGVLGNPESLKEESHSIATDSTESLVEYPNYTKPVSWRGLDVPEILLSGNHGEIAKWRRAESERRTRELDPE